MPRNQNANFEELHFDLIKENGKYAAYCHFCEKKLTNTAASRLKAHRGICKNNNPSEENGAELYMNPTEPQVIQELLFDATGNEIVIPAEQDATQSSSGPGPQPVAEPPKRIKRKRNSTLDNFVDRVTEEQAEDMESKLCSFFFGCNIPFSVVESDHFKNFVKALRPGFMKSLPGRKSLSGSLLDKKFEECIALNRGKIGPDSVLLIDGWKNSSSNSKTILTMLHNARGAQAFVYAWDLTGEAETGERLREIVLQSMMKAKSMYNTDVYAVVSDNASNMLKMGQSVPIWHSNCSSHVGNLLAKDVLCQDLAGKVNTILKEFKRSQFERALVDLGGSKIKLSCETRWCSHRDAFDCLIKNQGNMKVLIANDSRFKKIKPIVKALLFDDDFLEHVQEHITLLDSICMLINSCQDPTTSIADAAHHWLNLTLPINFSCFENCLKSRREMALNIYALTAYYLHPKYSNDAIQFLSRDQLQRIQEFLINELTVEGISSLYEFQEKTGLFERLSAKNIKDPTVFWGMCKIHHSDLSNLAIKLQKIPSSSAQIERAFSNWSYIHSPVRNRLDFEKSSKLLHIYYTHKMLDSNHSDEY